MNARSRAPRWYQRRPWRYPASLHVHVRVGRTLVDSGTTSQRMQDVVRVAHEYDRILMERDTSLETPTLARLCSTTERSALRVRTR
jgi:hypothetical protein